MKIRTKFILFVIVIHLVALVLSYFVFREQKWIFLVSELFILISVFICWQIYNQLIQPLQLLVQGAEAIADRDFNVRFVETGKYEMDKLIQVYNHMMDELRLERTRQQEQHFFLEKLIHTSPTGILILDFDGKIEAANPMAISLLEAEEAEVVNKQIDTVSHPILKKVSSMKTGTSGTVTIGPAATYKVHKSHFVDRGFSRHFVMIEVLTAEILEAEKNAYGKVIRMMAHEVNNTIGPVNSIMQSALKKLQVVPSDPSLTEALQVAVDRNNNLNIFMRNFADLVRIPLPNKQLMDIATTVTAVAKLMETRAGNKNITFTFDVNPSPMMVQADRQQLEQVLINVIKNAVESIEADGEISFVLDHRQRRLVISDTGKGIDDGLAEKLFTPFFSTKKDGQGIGLTLIREILFNHGFTFSLKSYQSKGHSSESAVTADELNTAAASSITSGYTTHFTIQFA
jgi:two-component system, NtrC family, nitrogen regulation sensor histidine kinase NtrY